MKTVEVVNKNEFLGLIMVNVGGGLHDAGFFLYICTRKYYGIMV